MGDVFRGPSFPTPPVEEPMKRPTTVFLSIIACVVIAGCATDTSGNLVAPTASSAQISSSPQSAESNDELNGEDRDESEAPYPPAVIGDTPYGAVKLAEFPSLVAKINADTAVSFVAHLGDIKAGKNAPCTDEYFATVRS